MEDDITLSAAIVFMFLNAPTGTDKLSRTVRLLEELEGHLSDTNLGQLLRRLLADYSSE